jgi:Uma2 family endonuclease
MVAHTKTPYITPQEYLERERKAETKSEFYDGLIVAMAGASPEHNAITFNLAAGLGPQLGDKNCRGYGSDLRGRVSACNAYFYPDATVVCGEPQYDQLVGLHSLLNPTLIIEVLSDSTERTDRREKFDCYQTLDSLKTYVLVAQDSPRIELFTRQADGSWRYEPVRGLDAVVKLESIGCTLRLADVYARVEFPSAERTEMV